ncbi:hypothetical protein [[Clostridium] symbiosum]|uniref:hypothetical protein n=1 Tax=Clostridium symbiosum TaxID=1512 RepID=UPI001D06799C|nr:hypothetical protein [[Clostridium] symbiosum]MCB6351227.1 hypothetical protein [[Clostridium] symbiosum]
MATNTTNYSFKKPDESDFYDVQDQNGNWDMADEALKSLDTPTFEDYTGSTPVPAANTAIDGIKSKTKLSALMSNIKAAFKGACLIGHIVNNCVTNNPNLPLSAAQGKVLMDLYTQLNGDILISSGSVAAVKGADTTICTLTLKAGHRYIILGGTSVSIAENASCMSASISVRNGVTSEWTGAGAAKTWMSNGGGCVTWAYAVCTTDVIVALDGYGYSDSTYTYGGRLLAIQLR